VHIRKYMHYLGAATFSVQEVLPYVTMMFFFSGVGTFSAKALDMQFSIIPNSIC